jgi:amino acid transporter
VHPRYHTPALAIAVQCAIAFVLSATSGFATLAIIANVSVLVLYLLCCIAAWELRRKGVRTGGTPFAIPGGAVVPWLAVAVIVWILSNATAKELGVVAGVMAAAAVLFWVRRPAGLVKADQPG